MPHRAVGGGTRVSRGRGSREEAWVPFSIVVLGGRMEKAGQAVEHI